MFDGELPPEILRDYPAGRSDYAGCSRLFYGCIGLSVFVFFPVMCLSMVAMLFLGLLF